MSGGLTAVRLADRAAARLRRFYMKRRLAAHRAFIKAPHGPKRVTIDGMQFDLDLAETTDLTIDLTRALPGGKNRRVSVQELSPGDVVFDIGANVGYFAVEYGRAIGPTGKLYAFEPNPRMVERLRAHVALNRLSNVTVVTTALGNQTARMDLFVPPGNDPGSATLCQDWRKDTYDEKHSVPVVRLDDYVQKEGIDRVDFIKLDVEGFEPYVLDGAQETLRRYQPRLMVEVYGLALAGVGRTTDDLLRSLVSLGYDLYKTVYGSDRLIPIAPGRRYGGIFDVHCVPARSGKPI